MTTTITLNKSTKLPQFLQEVFRRVDKKAFDELNDFFTADFRLYFAHYVLHGIAQGIGFVGAFDNHRPATALVASNGTGTDQAKHYPVIAKDN
jgi:hypothetical protein